MHGDGVSIVLKSSKVMLETWGRDTGSLEGVSGEPDALKGARPVRREVTLSARGVEGSSPFTPAYERLPILRKLGSRFFCSLSSKT